MQDDCGVDAKSEELPPLRLPVPFILPEYGVPAYDSSKYIPHDIISAGNIFRRIYFSLFTSGFRTCKRKNGRYPACGRVLSDSTVLVRQNDDFVVKPRFEIDDSVEMVRKRTILRQMAEK